MVATIRSLLFHLLAATLPPFSTELPSSSTAEKAVSYLMSQSLPSGGWRDEQTSASILGILAYNPVWYLAGAANDPKAELAVKQLEVEVLAKANTGQLEADVSPGQLAQYLGALQATCRSVECSTCIYVKYLDIKEYE